MAKPEKDKCPKCGSTEFSVALDKAGKPMPDGKHYCSKCQNIWVPGLVGLNRVDVLLKNALTENVELKKEITKLREENEALKSQLETVPTADGDIFS